MSTVNLTLERNESKRKVARVFEVDIVRKHEERMGLCLWGILSIVGIFTGLFLR